MCVRPAKIGFFDLYQQVKALVTLVLLCNLLGGLDQLLVKYQRYNNFN